MADENLGEAVLFLSTDASKLIAGISDAKVRAIDTQRQFDVTAADIQTRFSERFEHVGVHIFGIQLLELAGISGHARPIISLLMLTVNQAAAAMGVAAGMAGLLVGGLFGIAAIIYLVINGHKKHTDALQENIKKTQDLFVQHLKTIDTLKAYEQAGGKLTDALKALKEATTNLANEEAKRLITSQNQIIATTEKSIQVIKERIETVKAEMAANEALRKANVNEVEEHVALGGAILGEKGKIESLNSSIRTLTDQLKIQKADLDAMRRGYKDAGAQVEDLAEKTRRYNEHLKEEAQHLQQAFTSIEKTGAQSIGSLTSQFARGKISFHDFAQSVIEDIEKMILEMMVLKFLGFGIAGSFGSGLISGSGIGGGRVASAGGGTLSLGGGGSGGTITQNFNVSGMDFGSAEAAKKFLRTAAAQMRSGAVEAVAFSRAAADQNTLQSGRTYR